MLLFGGDIDVHHRERLVSLDGWITFQVREIFCMRVLFQWLSTLGCLPALHWSLHWQEHWGIRNWFVKLWDAYYLSLLFFNSYQAPVRIGVIFKHLRKLMDSLLERKLANPRMNLEGNFNLTSNCLLNESSLYLYAYLFEQPLCCERTHNTVFHFYPLQMRRPYRSSQNWSSQKTCSEEVPVCIQSWIDYKLNVDKPHGEGWDCKLYCQTIIKIF